MATSNNQQLTRHGLLPETSEFYLLWLIAILTYGIGDGMSSMAIIASPGLVEANPLVRFAVGQYGLAGLAALKIVIFGVCLAISLDDGRAEQNGVLYYAPGIMLVVAGTFATAVNLLLLWG